MQSLGRGSKRDVRMEERTFFLVMRLLKKRILDSQLVLVKVGSLVLVLFFSFS